jgi:hypothetical protein
MRKTIYAIVALIALVATSVAVAHGIEGAKSQRSVAATFSATGSNVSTRTCTTSDSKTVTITNGKYTGAASGDPDLTGAITLRARSVITSPDDVGTVSGSLRIDVASGKDSQAAFTAVYDHGTLAGLAVGKAHQPNARLIANLSAGFSAASGSAVEVSAGSCKATRPVKEKSEAHGTISALSSTSITVAGLTCAIPSDKTADVDARFNQGDVAEIHCSLVSNENTLTRIDGKKHH